MLLQLNIDNQECVDVFMSINGSKWGVGGLEAPQTDLISF